MSDKNLILKEKLSKLSKVFDLDEILNAPTDTKSVAKYYKVNKLAYTLLHSREGFVHLGISYDGKFKKSDLWEQAKIVEKYINDLNASKVLELATGRGANSEYLSRKYPQTEFYGLDLPDGQIDLAMNRSKNLKNFHVQEGDFHNLQKYDTNSFDLVFVIEALCYSDHKERVLNEVHRILKKDGIFIVIDGFADKHPSEMTADEKLAAKLLEKGMRVGKFESEQAFINLLEKTGFRIVQQKDLSREVQPTLNRLERRARVPMSLPPVIARLILRNLASEFTHNIPSGYLFSIALELGLSKYIVFVAQSRLAKP